METKSQLTGVSVTDFDSSVSDGLESPTSGRPRVELGDHV